METPDRDRIRAEVRSAHGAVARQEGGGCGPAAVAIASQRLGYSREELAAVPEGADLGLGCGNPGGIAALKPKSTKIAKGTMLPVAVAPCCTPTKSGQSCC